MAEQYAPIAKDESFNTTDLTPKNIADVLQDGLATLASSVKPTADEIPFDNTGTSLVSTDVEGAIKEIDGKFITTTITATTTSTGAVLIPSTFVTNYQLIGAYSTDNVCFIFRRDLTYLTVIKNDMTGPLADTNVTILATFYKYT